jgi:hypothetical protein
MRSYTKLIHSETKCLRQARTKDGRKREERNEGVFKSAYRGAMSTRIQPNASLLHQHSSPKIHRHWTRFWRANLILVNEIYFLTIHFSLSNHLMRLLHNMFPHNNNLHFTSQSTWPVNRNLLHLSNYMTMRDDNKSRNSCYTTSDIP